MENSMLKDIGRLDSDMTKEIDARLSEIFELLDKGTAKSKTDAMKKLNAIAKSPNYFIREYLGKQMLEYKNRDLICEIAKKMLKHKFYGIRATALFFFVTVYEKDPEKVLETLEDLFESVPWEVESVINDLWRNHPDVMKRKMLEWLGAENETKRALSFHGMENIANQDPVYIMDFINRAIDDDSMEVQKKITHILTQVARSRPAECYPYIHEWLLDADDKRMKTLWVSMKKLANIVIQKSRRDKTQEFIMLTHRTIQDWRHDDNPNVAEMGGKLSGILKNNRNQS